MIIFWQGIFIYFSILKKNDYFFDREFLEKMKISQLNTRLIFSYTPTFGCKKPVFEGGISRCCFTQLRRLVFGWRELRTSSRMTPYLSKMDKTAASTAPRKMAKTALFWICVKIHKSWSNLKTCNLDGLLSVFCILNFLNSFSE